VHKPCGEIEDVAGRKKESFVKKYWGSGEEEEEEEEEEEDEEDEDKGSQGLSGRFEKFFEGKPDEDEGPDPGGHHETKSWFHKDYREDENGEEEPKPLPDRRKSFFATESDEDGELKEGESFSDRLGSILRRKEDEYELGEAERDEQKEKFMEEGQVGSEKNWWFTEDFRDDERNRGQSEQDDEDEDSNGWLGSSKNNDDDKAGSRKWFRSGNEEDDEKEGQEDEDAEEQGGGKWFSDKKDKNFLGKDKMSDENETEKRDKWKIPFPMGRSDDAKKDVARKGGQDDDQCPCDV